MRVLIKKIEPDVVNREGPAIISSFWIYGLVKSGREIKIFDSVPFDLRKFEGQELNLLIFGKLSSIPNDIINGNELYSPVLEGEYLGEFNIPDNWEIGWRFEPKNKENPITFHTIQTEIGSLIVKTNNLKNYSIKPGTKFKFKAIGFDLMAWEPTEGKNLIDPTTFEKNIIYKFRNLMDSTHEKSKYNTEQQIQLLKKELMNWNYDEIWLFNDILKHLSTALRSNHSFRTIQLLNKELIQNIMEKKSGKSFEYVVGFMLRKDIEEVREKIHSLLDIEFET